MNIHYKSEAIGNFYSKNRMKWSQFYASEQYIFEKVFAQSDKINTILDVGCACGGLGMALHEKFGIRQYFGIDINTRAIEIAKSKNLIWPMTAKFECADIVDKPSITCNKYFDLVVSLGCADWNTDTIKILNTCWEHTAIGGHFIFSFRLTNGKTLKSIDESYQHVQFDPQDLESEIEEKAPYVVTNVHEVLKLIYQFNPRPNKITAYGYWGKPSAVSVTPYDKIVFSVIAVQKKNDGPPLAEILLPLDLLI